MTFSVLAVDRALARTILTLAAPVILGMLTQTAMNVVDTLLVGQLPNPLSTNGQAALGISLPFFWVVGGFLAAISVGTQAITARRHGEEAYQEAGQVLTNSITTAVSLATIFSLTAFLFIPTIFPLLTSNPEVLAVGIPYCQLRFVGVVGMVITMSYKSFFDGIGRTYVHMVAALIMNAVNLALALALIFGLCGFPRLEVVGAGWAALISTYVGLGVMMLWSLPRHNRKLFCYYRWSKICRRVIREIIRLSLPAGTATVVVMSGFLLFLKVVSILDEGLPNAVHTSAAWIIIQILSIIFVCCIGFGTATATLVGRSMGALDFALAERYGWESVKVGVYIFATVGLVMFLFPDLILSLFNSDPQVIGIGSLPLRMMGAVGGIIAAAMIFMYALFGAGNSRFVLIVEVILHFGCQIPFAYLLGVQLELGMPGVFGGAICYAVGLATILGWKFHAGGWKKIRI